MTQTDTPKLWLDMTPEEKGALLLAIHEGKDVEWHNPVTMSPGMWAEHRPSYHVNDVCAYRVKPEPERETIVLYDQCPTIWTDCNPCDAEYRITFETIDGEPDCASIKMERIDD